MSFAPDATEPAWASRDAIGSADAHMLAREPLTMSQAEFRARFKGSAMKRAKRRGLARNAAVVRDNVGRRDDVPLPETALQHDELRVPSDRGHGRLTRQGAFRHGRTTAARHPPEPELEPTQNRRPPNDRDRRLTNA